MGGQLTAAMAACLYTTLLTDTGGFCYGSVHASTFGIAHDLVAAGADPVAVARDVYYNLPLSRMQLLGKALSSLQARNGLAWLSVTNAEMQQIGATDEDCEGIVNYALSIAGIEAAAFLRELPEGRIRLSLRGKGRINVAVIAERLGGGGHENAAGCTLDGPLQDATEKILSVLHASRA
jgi:phosphoesterase RecJ-like protein